ncbi:MAG: RagB/SusD family nutrient uptake outer membrane protein [Bacteroides sp.]|nr:RagB/SusD family nutrient uptake outer membrane protein [Bacteroides sp.]
MKLINYIGLAAIATMSLTSCSDFLDADNKSTANDDADAYLTAHPESLRPVAFDAFKYFATHLELHEEATDLYFVTAAADGYGDFQVTAEDGTVTDYYKKSYKAIDYANGMVHYGGADTKLGHEGRFLRGLGYYHLVQQFGSVPYVTEYIQSSTRDYPREDLGVIYSSLIADLTEVYNAKLLPAVDHEGNPSLQAVAALLAKLELSAAWDLDTQVADAAAGTYTVTGRDHFVEAAKWAELAINGVKLTMPFEQKWSPFNEGNAEEIFSMQYDRAGFPGDVATGGHSMMNQYMSYYGNCQIIGQKGTGSGGKHRMSYKALRLFDRDDERFNGTFMTTYYNCPLDASGNVPSDVWGKDGYLAYFNCTDAEKAEKRIAFQFFPWYYTESEAREALAAIPGKTIKPGEKEKFGIINPQAVILDYPSVTIIPFEENGTLGNADSQSTKDFISPAYGGVCVKKYDDAEADNVIKENDYRDIPVFHVSDMYLVAAEAYLMAGNEGQALAKVNDVRNRAKAGALSSFGAYEAGYVGITNVPFTVTPLDVILDERGRELYAERTRYEDLRRTKQLIRYNLAFSRVISSPSQMQNPKGEYKWLRPIPANEINFNTSMTLEDQNPGY